MTDTFSRQKTAIPQKLKRCTRLCKIKDRHSRYNLRLSNNKLPLTGTLVKWHFHRSTIFGKMLFTVEKWIIVRTKNSSLDVWNSDPYHVRQIIKEPSRNQRTKNLGPSYFDYRHPFLILEFNRFFHPGLRRNVISVPIYTQAQRVILSKYKVKVKSTLCSFTTFKIY